MFLPRVVSTGILAFSVRVMSVFTGLAYVTLLSRRLAADAAASIAMYGYWSQIQALLLYPALVSAPIVFWATRDAARGGRVMGTSLAGALLLSIPAALAYLPAAVMAARPEVFGPFLLAVLILPASMAAQSLDAVARGRDPRYSLYGLVAFELGKLAATYLLLVPVPLSLTGAILGMLTARIVQSIILALSISTIDRPSLRTLMGWYRAGWLPLALQLSVILSALDQALIPIIYGRPEPTAFFNAAQSAAAPVGYSAWLSFALYPLLLAGGGIGEMRSAGRLTMLFAIPMLLGAITYAPSILGLLRPEFGAATLAMRLMGLAMFLGAVDLFLESVLTGVERRDFTEGRVWGTLLSTNLIIRLGITSMNFLASIILAFYAALAGLDLIYFVTLWALLHLAAASASTLIRLRIAREHIHLPLGVLNPGRYLIASIPMVVFLLVVGQVPKAPFLQYLFDLAIRIGTGAILYFGSLSLVDRGFRERVLRLIWGR
jgi:hypothetical protein